MPNYQLYNKKEEIVAYIKVENKRNPIQKAMRKFIQVYGVPCDQVLRLPIDMDLSVNTVFSI